MKADVDVPSLGAGPDPSGTPTVAWRRVAAWASVLALGLVLLIGRYDWSGSEDRFARRGYVLSAYLFVLTLLLTFFLVRALCRPRWVALAATASAFVVLTLPYRWLGLADLYYYRGRGRQWYTIAETGKPDTQFLPKGPLSTFPHDILLFTLLAAIAIAIGVVAWRRGAAETTAGRRKVVALVALFVVIVFQSFLHSGVRAPYVYMTHYQEPETYVGFDVDPTSHPRDLWFSVSHWSNGAGTVIADQYVYSAVEDYFHGAPRDTNNQLIRRPYGFYIASQFSYFVNTYYVWIVINILAWFAAVLAGYALTLRLAERRTALFVGAMIASGTGFVAFVGTPAMYLQAYAVVITSFYLLERLLIERRSWAGAALFGAALGASALVYDLVALYPVLVVYGLARKAPLRCLVTSVVGAYLIYRGFIFLHNDVLGIPMIRDNENQTRTAVSASLDLLRHPALSKLYSHATDVTGAFGVMLARMYFVAPLIPAIVGIRFLRTRAQVVLVAGLMAVTMGVIGLFRISGQLAIGNVPRFVYPTYPAVYLLAALSLTAIRATGPRRSMTAGRIAPWAFVAFMFVLSNVDALGFPSVYYEALEGRPPAFVP